MPVEYYKVYLITNTINGRCYVGCTHCSLEQRFRQHIRSKDKKGLSAAIRKYGKEHFIIECLEENIEPESALIRERFYIGKFEAYKRGYNRNCGGVGIIKHTAQTIERIRQKHLGTNNFFYGRRHTEETRQKMREAAKTRPPRGLLTSKKQSDALMGNTRAKGLIHIRNERLNKNKMVSPSSLGHYLHDGWQLGRLQFHTRNRDVA